MSNDANAANDAPGPNDTTVLDTWTFHVTDVPKTGLEERRTLDADQRAALASTLALQSIERFAVSYALKPNAGGRYRLTGSLSADVTQTCIVTLEPVPAKIREAVDETFVPADMMPADDRGEKEILTQDEPVAILNGALAVGHVLFEVLSSALDPYPRTDGAALDRISAAGTPEAQAAAHPFAALAKLKPSN